MAMTFGVTNQPAERVPADVLVVPVFADRELGPGADVVDAALGGGLVAFMEEAGFAGKVGETLAVPTTGQLAHAAPCSWVWGRATTSRPRRFAEHRRQPRAGRHASRPSRRRWHRPRPMV